MVVTYSSYRRLIADTRKAGTECVDECSAVPMSTTHAPGLLYRVDYEALLTPRRHTGLHHLVAALGRTMRPS